MEKARGLVLLARDTRPLGANEIQACFFFCPDKMIRVRIVRTVDKLKKNEAFCISGLCRPRRRP